MEFSTCLSVGCSTPDKNPYGGGAPTSRETIGWVSWVAPRSNRAAYAVLVSEFLRKNSGYCFGASKAASVLGARIIPKRIEHRLSRSGAGVRATEGVRTCEKRWRTLMGSNIFVNFYVIEDDLRRNYAMSRFVGDRHSDPRHRSGFEPPLFESLGRGFIENRITGALLHGQLSYFAARGINRHNACPVAGDMVFFRLVGVLGKQGANDVGFCRRQGRQILRNRFGYRRWSYVPFCTSCLLCFRRGSCWFSFTRCLTWDRSGRQGRQSLASKNSPPRIVRNRLGYRRWSCVPFCTSSLFCFRRGSYGLSCTRRLRWDRSGFLMI